MQQDSTSSTRGSVPGTDNSEPQRFWESTVVFTKSEKDWSEIDAAIQEEMDELKELELEDLEYRMERRERKQRKAKGRMPMHGKDLLRDRRSRIRGLR